MPHFHLATEAGRHEALRLAASPACDVDQAKRIRQLVAEAREADEAGDWRRCLLLTECANAGHPTPKEQEATAAEVRRTWERDLVTNNDGPQPLRDEMDHCLYCGEKFRNTVALILHVREQHRHLVGAKPK